jgi:hypothetical protein
MHTTQTRTNHILAVLVLVTTLLWGCNPFNSASAKQGFTEISKMQIKSLVMHVEFYKLQHGHYPNSLEQLNETDPLVPINDASQDVMAKEASLYNYEKLGDKYTLYSSGADGIPGTMDDFYPQISIPDSSKIGLIKKE